MVAEYPPIGTLIRRLQELGALGVRMTGSGAACFGIWPTVEEAEAAAAELRKRWAAVFVTTPVPADELR